MFFIGGIFQGKKEFEHFRQTIVCKKCGRLCSISVFMTYTCFSFFFIPLFKWGKQYYAVSNCCHTIYAIDAELGKAIEHGESVTLREEDLTIAGMGQAQEIHCPDCGYLLSQESLKHQKNSGFVREKQTTVFYFLCFLFYALSFS